MTTTIPTRSDIGSVDGLNALPGTLPGNVPAGLSNPLPGSNASAGLLDEATLMRMANQFFSLLPGSAAPDVNTATPLARPEPTPTATPAAPTQLNVTSEHASTDVGAGNTSAPTDGLFDIPSLFAPALPRLDPSDVGLNTNGLSNKAPVSVPSSPYYFVGETVAHTASAKSLPGQGVPSFNQPDLHQRNLQQPSGLSAPQIPGIPNESDLQQLLADNARHDASYRPAQTHGTPEAYYFLKAGNAAPVTLAALGAEQQFAAARPPFDVNAIRRDFPILSERVNGRQLIWLDNAATTHKPQAVIDRLAHFYAHENSNIHRAAHELAARATDAYEGARNKVARFLGAASVNEIIFVRGATEGINLVAQTFGKQFIKAGDEIIVSYLEHHANIVPWQMLTKETGAVPRVIPVDDDGQLILSEYQKLLNERTRLVAVTQVSNALGTITPVKEIIDLAHRVGARVLIDGAQAVSHMRVNVQALDADFYVFSGHKVFAPTGIGVVYGKQALLDQLPPYQGGGNMISDVTFEHTQYHGAPTRFEAGTGNIADAVGLGAAIDYLERIGMENVARYEHDLLVYATRGLQTVPGLKLIGTARDKASVLSFVLEGYSTEEVGKALNQEGIAVRSGHHCAQPILRRFGLEATVRPSLAFYNTCAEVDTLVFALKRLTAQSGR